MRKNVVVISVDDMIDVVRYRDAFGVELHTPAIDELMARGVTFENAFTPVPLCNPARVATLTGRSPFVTGVHHNNDARIGEALPAGDTIFGAAHEAGWFTASGGKLFHAQYAPQQVAYIGRVLDALAPDRGYNNRGGDLRFHLEAEARPERAYQDSNTADWAAEILKDPPAGGPFLLAAGFWKPHLNWNVPKKYFRLYDRDAIEVPEIEGVSYEDLPAHYRHALSLGPRLHERILSDDVWKEVLHGYLAAISFTDARIGELLQAMTRAGRWADTTVVLWSDHGYHLGDRDVWKKFTLWEEAASVPLVFVDPEVGRAGARVSTPASLLDLWPTLAGLTRLPGPRRTEGVDLSPLMADPSAGLERAGVVTSAYGSVSLRTETWRYNLYTSGEEELFRVDRGQIHGRDLLERGRYLARAERLREELDRELRKQGAKLVEEGESRVGGGRDEVFVVIGDGEAAGRGGDDVYHVTKAAEVVEEAGGGEDLVFLGGAARWRLPDHVENAVLTSGSRTTLVGNDEDNALTGGDRADRLLGREGNDRIDGGGGSDRIVGGRGDDLLEGAKGDDTAGGGFGADTLFGGRDADLLIGAGGDDALAGEKGLDLLRGGKGRDVLDGGRGADTLIGGRDADVLSGGGGRDVFLFARPGDSPPFAKTDRIRDFTPGRDLIDLSQIDAVAGGEANERFRWIGDKAFTGEAGQLRFVRLGSEVRIEADLDGDARAEFAISLAGGALLDRGDFVL